MSDPRIEALGIDTTRPGFYDEPAFIAAEQRDPKFLDAYAEHVESLSFDEGYKKYARERVRATAGFMTERLYADGRKGACVDMSVVLGRFLEQQGVWNYGCRGVVAIDFPPKSRLRPYFMRPYGEAQGHVWLRVPPFRIVDLTIGLQEYENGEEEHLPNRIIDESARLERPRMTDLIDESEHQWRRRELGREPRVSDLTSAQPETWTVRRKDLEIRYTKIGVTVFGDGHLDASTRLCLSGKYPKDLWSEFERTTTPQRAYVP